MRKMRPCRWTIPVLALLGLSAAAQSPAPSAVPSVPRTVSAVAATVNGQPIPESTVDRALDRIPPAKRDEARKQIIEYLVENLLIDQYVLQLPQYAVEKKEIDAKEEEVRAELKKQNKEFAKMLEEMKLTEAELREQIAADLRWTKLCSDLAKEDQLKRLFDTEKELFDGTMVRARHILLTPPMTDPKAIAEASDRLRAIKKEIEAKVEEGLAKLPAGTDPLGREKERRTLLDDAFAAAAKEKSQCPSKVQGGDVDYFQRSGKMVEPFAKAAFALKPFEMSDVVQTQFGVHLILLTERKPGLEVKFADVKDDVKDEFCDRLRERVVAKIKPSAKILIAPAPKSSEAPAPMPK